MAVELRSSLSGLIGAPVPAGLLFDHPGITSIAGALAALLAGGGEAALRPAALRRLGPPPPAALYLIGGAVGGDDLYLDTLAHAIGADPPCFALLYPPDSPDAPAEIPALADHFTAQLSAFQPEGPIALGGHSLGGLVAYEVALRLTARRREVTELVLLDAPLASPTDTGPPEAPWTAPNLRVYLDRLSARGWLPPELAAIEGTGASWALLDRMFTARLGAMRRYAPSRPFHGETTFLTPADPAGGLSWCIEAWRRWCPALKVARTSGHHLDMVRAPHVHQTARILRSLLRGAEPADRDR